jgi:hypothetical protein
VPKRGIDHRADREHGGQNQESLRGRRPAREATHDGATVQALTPNVAYADRRMQPYTSFILRTPGFAVQSTSILPNLTTGALTAPRAILEFVRRVHTAACSAPPVSLENVNASATLDGFTTFHTAVNSNRCGAVRTSAADSGASVYPFLRRHVFKRAMGVAGRAEVVAP